MHFGLGPWSQRHHIEKLIVRWPDGESETFTGVQPNRHYQSRAADSPWPV